MNQFKPLYTQPSSKYIEMMEEICSTSHKDHQEQIKHGMNQLLFYMEEQHQNTNSQMDEPLPFEEYALRISDIWKQHYKYVESSNSFKSISRSIISSLNTDNIIAANTIDIKVFTKGKPDDAIYEKTEYARKHVPRGDYLLEWYTIENPNNLHYFPLLRGFPKFSGHEDNGEISETYKDNFFQTYFKDSIQSATRVVSTRKENGDSGHLSMLKKKDGTYIFNIGSKLMHITISKATDIDTIFPTDESKKQFQGTYSISTTIMHCLETQLSSSQRQIFYDFLCETRLTACFEILQPSHQHIERLYGNPQLKFYGFTLPLFDSTVLNPIFSLKIAESMGLSIVPYQMVPYDHKNLDKLTNYQELLQSISLQTQEEGSVNVFINAYGEVIGLRKYKTVWYVCVRAIREKMKSCIAQIRKIIEESSEKDQDFSSLMKQQKIDQIISKMKNAIYKRLVSIQSFVSLNSEDLEKYYQWSLGFMNYIIHDQIPEYLKSNEFKYFPQHFIKQFPIYWDEYIKKLNGKVQDI